MTETRRRRAAGVGAAVAALAALHAAGAQASTNQQSIIQDEKQMLGLGPAVQARALDDAKALGADIIRVNVTWRSYAPKASSKRRPKRFNGSNPRAYPRGRFAMLDSLVAGAQQRGLTVLLTPTGPVPTWASRCRKKTRTCKPSPTEFGRFVRALGKRYPQVSMWSIWNEPNLKSWLSPQYTPHRSRPVLQSAALYRSLARSAIAGLRATGHRSKTTILLGETAPIACRDPASARRTAAPRARRRGCCARRARGQIGRAHV